MSAHHTKNIKVGVLGLGAITHFYLDALHKSTQCDFTAVCDLNPSRLRAFQDMPYVTQSIDEFVRLPIDAIIVNLPNDLHKDACLKSLYHGKHVCCEKPLALSGNDARELTRVAQERGLQLYTAFHRRFNAPVQKVASRFSSNDISELRIRYFEKIEEHCGEHSWYLNPTRCGGGCVSDNGPNAIDLARALVGDFKIHSVTVHRDHEGIDQQAVIYGSTPRKVRVALFLDWQYEFGELKDVEFHLHDGTYHRADMLDGFTQFKSSLFHEYEGVLTEFLSSIQSSKVVSNNAAAQADGVRVAEMVDQCYRLINCERSTSNPENSSKEEVVHVQ